MLTLHRVTTEFVHVEDRIRLTGATQDGGTLILWITQRLMNRLLPIFAQVLEEEAQPAPQREVLQSFAQQKARAEIPNEPPVKAAPASESWLIVTVDVTPSSDHVDVVLKAGPGRSVALLFTRPQLRQWLNGLYAIYQLAHWPQEHWPSWMQAASAPARPASAPIH